MRFSLFAVLIYSILFPTTVYAEIKQWPYEKKLDATRVIRLVREDTNYKPPAERIVTNADGMTTVFPDRYTQYSLYLIDSKSKSRKPIWRIRRAEYDKSPALLIAKEMNVPLSEDRVTNDDSGLKIYDVIWEKERYLVLYSVSHSLRAALFSRNADILGGDKPDETTLFIENWSEAYLVDSIQVQGTLKQDSLSLLVKDIKHDYHLYFFRNGKWSKKRTDSTTDIIKKSFVLDGKPYDFVYTIRVKSLWEKPLPYPIDPQAEKEVVEEPEENIQSLGRRLNATPLVIRRSNEDAQNPVETELTTRGVSTDSFFKHPAFMSPRSDWWSGDAVIDEKENLIYAVVSNGSRLLLQIMKIDAEKVDKGYEKGWKLTGDPKMPIRFYQKWKSRDVPLPKEMSEKLPFIHRIALKKEGADLVITYNENIDENPAEQRKIIYNTTSQKWSEALVING